MTTIENVECFAYCDGCECEYNLKKMYIVKEIYLCVSCYDDEEEEDFEENYDCCVNCKDCYLKEDMKVIDGKNCCKGCYKKCKKMEICEICEGMCHRISLKYYNDGDSLWCEDCCEEQERFEREQKRKNKFK
jgi:hypothetical protein